MASASGTTTLTGTDGSDNYVGGSGSDTLYGGAGADRLNGGSGDDLLNGGSGFDTVLGGSGSDTLIYKAYENQYILGSTGFSAANQQISGGTIYSGTDQTTLGVVAPATGVTGTTFQGYDSYDGGNGAVQLGKTGATPDVDTLQIWLSATQLADQDIQAEISYYKNTWVPAHISAQTGQADGTIYTFKTLDLKVSAIEKVDIRDSYGNLTIVAHDDIASGTEAGGVNNTTPGTPVGPGNVLSNDFDFTASATMQVSAVAAGSSGSVSVTPAGAIVQGTYGVLNIHADGCYSYTINNTTGSAADKLAQDETGTDIFTYSVVDGTGATGQAKLNITITGTNDAPAITSAAQSGSVSEGDGQPAASMTATGQVTFSDVDTSDTHALTVSVAAAHGTASVDADGTWHYTATDSGAVDALAVGETLADSFTVQVDDHHGGLATQVVNITITGTNDAPAITSAAQSGSVSEGDGQPSVSSGSRTLITIFQQSPEAWLQRRWIGEAPRNFRGSTRSKDSCSRSAEASRRGTRAARGGVRSAY